MIVLELFLYTVKPLDFVTYLNSTLWGVFKYYIIRLGGGLNQNDDFDDVSWGAVWDLNDDVMMVPFPLKIRRLLQ